MAQPISSPLPSDIGPDPKPDTEVLARRRRRTLHRSVAGLLVVALLVIGALISVGQSSARPPAGAGAGRSMAGPPVLRRTESRERLTPQEIAKAKAEYAKLTGRVQQQIQRLKSHYNTVLSQLKSCAATPTNPACLVELQAAMNKYEAFMETWSQLISGWQGSIRKVLGNLH
jgi:hypothetical protein